MKSFYPAGPRHSRIHLDGERGAALSSVPEQMFGTGGETSPAGSVQYVFEAEVFWEAGETMSSGGDGPASIDSSLSSADESYFGA